MNTQQKLQDFAFTTAYPYIAKQAIIKDHIKDISVLLVGSTATGLCTEHSDVDICLLCSQKVFDIISLNTNWCNGRPTELYINGTQLHYYAISYELVIRKIQEFDDVAFYVYGTALAINDNSGLFRKLHSEITNSTLNGERKEKAIDILGRRNLALNQILLQESDAIIRIRMGIEIVEHLLTAIALTDNLYFDKRKRFYSTSLNGKLGTKLKNKIDELLTLISKLSNSEDVTSTNIFIGIVNECIDDIN